MNHNLKNITATSALMISAMIMLISCEDLVEDGYRIDYPASDALLTVEAMDYESGAVGDVVSYKLTVQSDYLIKSCVVQATEQGAGGSGYDVGEEGFDDPFADHNYGTLKKDIKSFTVKYDYIVPVGINNSRITFSVIDEQGKVSQEVSLKVVPGIKAYPKRSLYSKSQLFYDAFATINGLVYPDIKTNYSTLSEENLSVQEEIDIVFYYDSDANESVICAPNDGNVSLGMQVENATKFKMMEGISEAEFNEITAASLVTLTKNDSINYQGTSQVRGVMVGDIVGFTTDVNALHSQKTGLIKVNSLHPVNVGHYQGTAYVMECDIISQIDE